MALPRSCAACGGVHRPGARCPLAQPLPSGWARISRAVVERDGYQCRLRLPGCTALATTADHIIRRSQGGDSSMENLRAACRPCNSRRH